ncbi:translation factor GTPase family protein [Defluviitalea saccharophila]|uniref:TetM/TetW/TetO/TetS family tetracycline resistance ribosomal protection protein n=1 Tax=Defluviitalea saccharophila TaxID=879970 RepID=A0ABZ2YAY3_9FIRM
MTQKLVIGILANVDAGKTTLSESLLYLSGKIGKMGRVDNQDAYLDTDALEKARGITIFSKQAVFNILSTQITLLDTPGHVDFSMEMERTLQVLDYAILVISGADGVQSHTKTLWRLLKMYQIPIFIFINKMDQMGTDKDKLMKSIKSQLSDRCVSFEKDSGNDFYEEVAMCGEALLEDYLENGDIHIEQIKKAIKARRVFPCFFGSALKLEGVEYFMEKLIQYALIPSYPESFGARVFKITRDEQGNRLTHMKLTGGKLKVRDILSGDGWEEKINQIRIYSGKNFEAVGEISAGTVCAVTGLAQTIPGEGLGIEQNFSKPILEPVLFYQIKLPEGYSPREVMPKLKEIEEENPELHIVWDETLQEIQAQIMGEVQIEILQSLIKDRFNLDVSFDDGRIVYKETITNTVEGVGHFEPLRHYAEVHLLLEPGERGSGLQFATNCSEDLLSRNWQRLVLTHLEEKVHKGVLTGSAITDMKITLVSGRAHNKHTEGGDFREATYRAVRQGLKEANSILLEPYYSFQLEVPREMVGRAMMDIEKMYGTSEILQADDEMTTLVGSAPVVTMRNYQKELMSYTKGFGRLFCTLKGYEPCHNAEEVIGQIGYDSEADVENPTGSIFCSHGAGFYVRWDEVKEYMHLESYLKPKRDEFKEDFQTKTSSDSQWISLEEIDQILGQTVSNQGKKSVWKKTKSSVERYYESMSSRSEDKPKSKESKLGTYLLVDGYNIIHAWPELKSLAEDNMDSARVKLLDILSNYKATKKCEVIVVFDAYRVKGHVEEMMDYHNIHVVFTKEAQTADQYIEKFSYDHSKKYHIIVATSDGLQQIIVRGAGSSLLSASELKLEIENTNKTYIQSYLNSQPGNHNRLADAITQEEKAQIEAFKKPSNHNK